MQTLAYTVLAFEIVLGMYIELLQHQFQVSVFQGEEERECYEV